MTAEKPLKTKRCRREVLAKRSTAVQSNDSHRRCIVTGDLLPRDELLRFVLSPDAIVVPDLKNKLPGRGVWVRADRQSVTKAQERHLFDRGFKAKCRIDGDLAQRVQDLLEDRALGYLALANKAGLVVQGFEKTNAALLAGNLGLLVAACDGAEDGRKKLKARLETYLPEATLIEIFSSDQLSLALGRTNVIHAGVAKSELARNFQNSADSVASFTAGNL